MSWLCTSYIVREAHWKNLFNTYWDFLQRDFWIQRSSWFICAPPFAFCCNSLIPFSLQTFFQLIFFTVSTQTEEEYQAWARSRDEATSTPTTTSSTTSPPTTTSKVSLSDREGEDEVGPGSAYDYVADEGDYYNTELDDKRRITTSTPETTKATHRITSTTTAMPTTASPVSSTSTATYVGDYEDVDSHMARVGQEPDICVGLLDRWWLFIKDSPFFFQCRLVERGALCILRPLHVEILRFQIIFVGGRF